MGAQPTLIVIDYETTALQPSEGCVWQVAACAVRHETIIGQFEAKVRPLISKFQAKNRATLKEFSGLDDAALLALLDEQPFSVVVDLFQRWIHRLGGCRKARAEDECPHTYDTEGSCVICASIHPDAWSKGQGYPLRLTSFNVAFDRTFFEAEQWGWVEAAQYEMPIEWQACVMDRAAKAMGRTGPRFTRCTPYGRVNTVSLASACEHFGIVNEKAHDALADTRAAAELAIKLGLE
jgi:DNA polymerase III epsilon subunit-like protein